MHRHSLWSRAIAVVIAPWFAVVVAEPAALHACALHSGMVAAPAASANAAASPAPAHSHSSTHAAPVADAGNNSAPAAPDHGGAHCTCLGGCCAASAVGIDTPAALSWIPADIRRARPLAAADAVPAAAAEHLLPFANGPPSRA